MSEVLDIAALNLSALPNGWHYRAVSEIGATGEQPVLTGPFGTNLGRGDFVASGVPLLTIGCLTQGGINLEKALFVSEEKAKELSRYRLKEGDLLFSRMASVGRAGLVPKWLEGALFNYHIMRLRLDESRIDTRLFINYVRGAKQVRDYLKAVNHGATRDGINTEQLLGLPVAVPPLAEQREIVAELEKQFSRLDEAVANLQRVKANLKRFKDSVYSEAFGNAPNSTLGELFEVGPQNGLYLPKDMYGDGVPILRIDDYQTAWIRPVQELRRVKATQEQISTWALCEDDLVVNRVNSMTHLGKCVRIPKSLAGTVFESNMMRMRLTAAASPKYVEHYLASRLGKKRLTGNAKWAVNQASINQKDVRATPIFVPDLAVQMSLVTEIDRQLSIVREVEAEVDANLQRAQSLRQSVLQRAFSTASPKADALKPTR